jgi:hypothetical protein
VDGRTISETIVAMFFWKEVTRCRLSLFRVADADVFSYMIADIDSLE